MSASILQLNDSIVSDLSRSGDTAVLRFSPACILKSEGVPGVDASTRWNQTAELRFGEGEIEGEWRAFPLTVEGGRISVNNMTYVDIVPVPLESAGHMKLVLSIRGADSGLVITGSDVRLDLIGDGQYVEHLPAV